MYILDARPAIYHFSSKSASTSFDFLIKSYKKTVLLKTAHHGVALENRLAVALEKIDKETQR